MTFATLAISAVLGQSAPVLSQTKIIDVAVFKNGTAIVVHQAKVPDSGILLVENPPKASLGTLWIFGEDAEVISVVMTEEIKREEDSVPAGSIVEVLKANKGKVMEIIYYLGQETKSVKGFLKQFDGEIAYVESGGAQLFIPLNSIQTVGGSGLSSMRTKVFEKVVPALRIKAKPGAMVNIMGLQAGIGWTAAYSLDMSDPRRLSITAKATIVNDLGDLDGVGPRLVTGYPNLLNGGLDPLTAGQLVGYPDGFFRGPRSENLLPQGTQDLAYMPAPYSMSFAGGPPASAAPAVRAEDLFVTTLEKLVLKKGERGYYILFNTTSAYKHIYTLALPENSGERGYGGSGNQPLTVWHQIEFENGMSQPWSSGTALITKDGQMIGQDYLEHTLQGANTLIRLANAKEVTTDVVEEESNRERGAIKDRNGVATHDLVTVAGKSIITNETPQAIEMKVTKALEGEVVEANQGAQITKSVKRLNEANPTSHIEWRPTLKQGEKVTLEYRYKVYVPVR